MPRLKWILLTLFAFSPCIPTAAPQSFATIVSAVKTIPRENYKTWSLFLFCDSKWVVKNQADLATGLDGYGTYGLFKDFQTFGNAIGPSNLAVWFWKTDGVVNAALAGNVDVARSQRFCTAYKLKPTKGPYLVVTSTYPDETNLPKGLPADSAVFTLDGTQLSKVTGLLDQLSQNLNPAPASVAASPAPGPVVPPPPATWEVRLMESAQLVLNDFGCAWTFKMNAGPVEANLHACKSS